MQTEKPFVVFSIAGGDPPVGDSPSNSTIKLFNQWSMILQQLGIDSCIATHTGEPVEWMVNHTRYEKWGDIVENDREFKLVTAGWDAEGVWDFANITDQKVYVYMPQVLEQGELAFLNTMMGQIEGLAVPNRYLQAWIMAAFQFNPHLLIIPTDCSVFYPPENRDTKKIGFFHTEKSPHRINFIGQFLKRHGIDVEFVLLKGTEQEVADSMRQCKFFLGINSPYDPFWGSGIAITHQEAMACGCAVVAFDLLGNREYMLQGENAMVVDTGDISQISDSLLYLLANPQGAEAIGNNAAYSIRARRSIPFAIPSLIKWLGLEEQINNAEQAPHL